jgi:hypothetical protein
MTKLDFGRKSALAISLQLGGFTPSRRSKVTRLQALHLGRAKKSLVTSASTNTPLSDRRNIIVIADEERPGQDRGHGEAHP